MSFITGKILGDVKNEIYRVSRKALLLLEILSGRLFFKRM
jgi:hypothetical protein